MADASKAEIKEVTDSAATQIRNLADSSKLEIETVSNTVKPPTVEPSTSVLKNEIETGLQSVKTELQNTVNNLPSKILETIEHNPLIAGLIGAVAVNSTYEGVLQSQINELRNELNNEKNNEANKQDKPVQMSTIAVIVFDHCDQNHNPVYSYKNVSVIAGTEENEALKFQEIAKTNGQQCSITSVSGGPFANVLNEVRDIGSNLINASEQTISMIGQGFNALQDDGILSENNWKYTPEHISLKAGVLANLSASTATDALTVVNNQSTQTAAQLSQQINSENSNLNTNLEAAITNATNQRNQEIQQITGTTFSWEDLT